MALPGDGLANGHHLREGKQPPRLGRASMPGQHFCSSPTHLWYEGFAERLHNASHSHQHSAAQAVLQTLIAAQGTEVFLSPVWFTQHCLCPVFSKPGKCTAPVPDVAPRAPRP